MSSFSMWHWLIIGAIGYVIYRIFSNSNSSNIKFCKSCGHTGKSVTFTRGSIFIEIILWICFIVPGVIYSIWRLTSRRAVCASCQSPELVPTDSPAALTAFKTAPATPQSAERKIKSCPACAEEILAAAVKCKHCGSAV